MIVVKNTKELEERYSLQDIPDDEIVMVLGGLANKSKYNKERYKTRTTYTGRTIKQIISEMKQIESTIPESWSELQKAKKIYEILGKRIEYNYNEQEYDTQQSSNLTILNSRRGICAGYSLLYKEMMDRQGIECEYVRGDVISNGRLLGRHAWNVLLINNQAIPVDLTWDSGELQKGKTQLSNFGNEGFKQLHYQDKDEPNLEPYTYLTPEEVQAIDTTSNKETIKHAIEQTYIKFEVMEGSQKAKERVKRAFEKYIQRDESNGFTRNEDARSGIENIPASKIVKELVADYVENVSQSSNQDNVLDFAILQNMYKYDQEQAIFAVNTYIMKSDAGGFTRQNNARDYMQDNMTPQQTMDFIISNIVEREVQEIERNRQLGAQIMGQSIKSSFSSSEFEAVQTPKKSIIQKALDWIRKRIRTNEKNLLTPSDIHSQKNKEISIEEQEK